MTDGPQALESAELKNGTNPILIDRQIPLTIEEIRQISSDFPKEHPGHPWKEQRYQIGDIEASVRGINKGIEDYRNQEHIDQTVALLKSKGYEEKFVFERYIVNALIEQQRIAKRFGLPARAVFTNIKLDPGVPGSTMSMDNDGSIYLLPLKNHIDILKRRGATEDQIITELAGHMFHEAVHEGKNGLDETLLNGRTSIGEITAVTAQIAYYLDKGYHGPTSYDAHRTQTGIDKIQRGVDSLRDYDVATIIGSKLIFQSLRESYPELAKFVSGLDVLDACVYIVSKLSPEEREQLIYTLTKGITRAANEEDCKVIIRNIKQEQDSRRANSDQQEN